MNAGYTQGQDVAGQDFVVVAVKGTFTLPQNGQPAVLAEVQQPLFDADKAGGEPGLTAPVYEADYPLRKPHCDVILNGSAYAPEGRPCDRVTVGLRVGAWRKGFDVVGDRVWRANDLRTRPGKPEPFSVMPISYNNAFGGVDDTLDNHETYLRNPVGRGYHYHRLSNLVDGRLMPNTEQVDEPIKKPNGRYRPMALGPIGRHWMPRYKLAGTYDKYWQDNVFPFLPPDFDDAYHQCAPTDQQIPYPKGNEEVTLLNLTPEGKSAFRLPDLDLPVAFLLANGQREEATTTVDTLTFEPDEQRFTITWRVSRRLVKDFFELQSAVIGRVSNAWWRAKTTGKTYYSSLRETSRPRGVADAV